MFINRTPTETGDQTERQTEADRKSTPIKLAENQSRRGRRLQKKMLMFKIQIKNKK